MAAPLAALPGIEGATPGLATELLAFSCGGGTPYEQEVDDIIRRFGQELAANASAFLGDLRLAHNGDLVSFRDSDSGSLLGITAFYDRSLADGVLPPWAYVAVIGIDAAFRGRRLPDGSRIGHYLLHCTLERTRQLARLPTPPPAWALIGVGNDASQANFSAFEFEPVINSGAYHAWHRPAGVMLPQPSWGACGWAAPSV